MLGAEGGYLFMDQSFRRSGRPQALVKPAAEAGIAFNPGPEWAVSPHNSSNCLRLCFAMPSKQTIREGVAELARVCYEQTGIPQRSGNVTRT